MYQNETCQCICLELYYTIYCRSLRPYPLQQRSRRYRETRQLSILHPCQPVSAERLQAKQTVGGHTTECLHPNAPMSWSVWHLWVRTPHTHTQSTSWTGKGSVKHSGDVMYGAVCLWKMYGRSFAIIIPKNPGFCFSCQTLAGKLCFKRSLPWGRLHEDQPEDAKESFAVCFISGTRYASAIFYRQWQTFIS